MLTLMLRETHATAPSAWRLTPRELQILPLLFMGNADIAAELGTAESTVKGQVARLLVKLGLANRTAAYGWWIETGLSLIAVEPIADAGSIPAASTTYGGVQVSTGCGEIAGGNGQATTQGKARSTSGVLDSANHKGQLSRVRPAAGRVSDLGRATGSAGTESRQIQREQQQGTEEARRAA